MKEISFQGHVVTDKGIMVDPKKTEVVRNWPRPLTPTNIRSFLKLVTFIFLERQY